MAKVYKEAGIVAARIASESDEMDKGARKVRAKVERLADQHIDTGAFKDSLESGPVQGPNGVTDRAVWTTDPNALSIEFGHMHEGKFIPGLFIFNRAKGSFDR